MGFYSKVIIPYFYDFSMDSEQINKGRQNLLSKVTEENVVEIGFGTGINLKFYPENVKHIIGIDANEGMLKQAEKKISNSKIRVQIIHQSSEKLPFEENSIDAVVSTYTLCSIKHVESALREIFRVLKPEGRYYFLEHGLADKPFTQQLQHILNPIQNIWADGCNLNRNISSIIAESGLRIIEMKNYYMKRDPKIVGYMYEGIAKKGIAKND
ncbi:SAM-dependent methyltransferase [Ignavibacterium album JCM 16511]|uniref:SAM-dependent methyltransferase n=1 Tax=Ignavibacterium album (strain DSM 19864 / JCM 16511 / NBRC 101810 / Mat9-16) TaxID=945713 RepID=I0ANR8_IGNAJ|nr:class I SAM-dependent methyltransferase [Ignavibacterium album]AFH50625.1 SAM-dependent methyltransferase [Ignavibacterium album JCM 16511]